MEIKIDQTLHGYNHGHQLLASSFKLNNDDKELLLIHSDLSGSNIDTNFKEYYTGYPLTDNKYAFAKTWYADEMPRPGCVWTHTLVINFSDVGKIPNFIALNKYFKRPNGILEFDTYESKVNIDLLQTANLNKDLSRSTKDSFLYGLYENPKTTLIIPAETSSQYDDFVLNIWSDQWPRLRRKFTFCTGALSLKTIDNKEFDLQIVPSKNSDTLIRKSEAPFLLNTQENYHKKWMDVFDEYSENRLRRFLWLYGSDVDGSRENYIPLILLFEELQKTDKKLKDIVAFFNNYLSDSSQGQLLKTKVFSEENLFELDQGEVMNYLLTTPTLPIINADKLNIQERVVSEFKNNKISFEALLENYLRAKPGRLDSSFWTEVKLDGNELLSLIFRDSSLLNLFKDRLPSIAEESMIWNVNYNFQLEFYEILKDLHCDWNKILFAVLDSGSSIALRMLSDESAIRSEYVFKWQQLRNREIEDEIGIFAYRNHRATYRSFLNNNIRELSEANCNDLFRFYDYNEIVYLFDTPNGLKNVYPRISNELIKIKASSIILAIALNRDVKSPETLIPLCFEDLYYFAKKSLLKESNWSFIPIDNQQEISSNESFLTIFLKNFSFSPKLRSNVPSWDYCELLIRTLVNKFIKNGWHLQFLLDSISTEELLSRFINYASSFRGGIKLLYEIFKGVSNGSLKLKTRQENYLKKLVKL